MVQRADGLAARLRDRDADVEEIGGGGGVLVFRVVFAVLGYGDARGCDLPADDVEFDGWGLGVGGGGGGGGVVDKGGFRGGVVAVAGPVETFSVLRGARFERWVAF